MIIKSEGKHLYILKFHQSLLFRFGYLLPREKSIIGEEGAGREY